ncbi:MAG: VCBS repeat-containing protein [Polyangiaceae bacterium]
MLTLRDAIGGLLGMVASLLLAPACGSGSASEESSGQASGSGGSTVTSGATSSGGSTSTSAGGVTSSGGTTSSSGGSTDPGVCAGPAGLPGPADDPSQLYEIEVHDMNGDGLSDVVTTTKTGVRVLIGDGKGGFFPPIDTPTANEHPVIAVGDVDGDGALDVVAATWLGTSGVTVLHGHGDGTFTAGDPQPNDADWAYSAALSDVDADGRPDFVLVGDSPGANDTGVHVMPQLPDGTFSAGAHYPVSKPRQVFSVDMNGDGALDLLVIGDNGVTLYLLPNLGDGTFGAAAPLSSGIWNEHSRAADLNGDGRLDLVLCSAVVDSSLFVQLQNADGSFGEAAALAEDWGVRSVDVVDYDADGKLDLVTDRGVLFGAGDGTFPTRTALVLGSEVVRTGDLDGDGSLDIVGKAIWTEGFHVFLRRDDGSLAAPALALDEETVHDVATGDLNGDGTPDLTLWTEDGIQVAMGHGDGTFEPAATIDAAVDWQITTADVDGDGLRDVITAGKTTLHTWLQHEDGTFGPAVTTALSGPEYAITTGDLDEDGREDIVIGSGIAQDYSTVYPLLFLRAEGDGAFTVSTLSAEEGGFPAVALADIDGDGHLDLLESTHKHNAVHVLFGHGDGAFDAPVLAVPHVANGLAVGDLDGDALPDIAVSTQVPGIVTVRNLGGGLFGEPVTVGKAFGAIRLYARDVDADGSLDLALESIESLHVCHNHGDGTFGSCDGFAACGFARMTAAADLDGDGRCDFVTACQTRPGVAVLQSTCLP